MMLTRILKGWHSHRSFGFLCVSTVPAIGIAILITSSPAKQSAPQFPVFTDITSFGPNLLYRNTGDGTFTEVSKTAGVADPGWPFPKWSMGAAFGDYDGDGYLDIYVANFAKFDSRHLPPRPGEPGSCMLKNVAIACPPDRFEGEQGILYHNNGNGTFTDVTRSAVLIRKDPGRGFVFVVGYFDTDEH